jgi:prepilin-type N-terminal cleavage/methylation domain-containing protein
VNDEPVINEAAYSSSHSRRVTCGPRGFTLVELVLSVAIMSMLMVGLASAILIASQALPSSDSPAHAAVAAAEAADLLAEELRSALWIRERKPASVEFALPDRDGDGAAERVRYAWSGVAGEPLTRQYNGGKVVTLLDAVQEFALAYEIKAVTEEYPGPAVESAEILLASYTTVVTDTACRLQPDYWIGQYIGAPALPVDASSWSVTRVMFQAKVSQAGSAPLSVQLQTANADHTPTGTVLDEVTLVTTALQNDWQWVDLSYDNASGFAPGMDLCLVLDNSAAATASESSVRINQEMQGGSGRLITEDAGASWQYDDDKSMYYYLYGTHMTSGPPQTATRRYVTGVGITLRTGDDPASRVVTKAQTLNTPELLSGWWQADFESDPTLDHNGDGQDDWVVREGGAFDTGPLVGGVWQADATLDTYPDSNFTSLTTAEVRFRNTTLGGDGAVFWINADWSGSSCAPIVAALQLQADGTQKLTVYRKPDEATKLALVQASGLSSDFVTLRLLIDPGLDTVNVRVNGGDYGTFAYSTTALPSDDRFASVYTVGSAAEFDSVSVRVSE